MRPSPNASPQRPILDAYDFRLALTELTKHGYDLEVSVQDTRRLHVTSKRTDTRWVIELLGHNDWPKAT
jgi:hypothetical protein